MEPGSCDRPPGKRLRLDAEPEAQEESAAGGEAREKAAGGEARKKPVAGGEARERPAAGAGSGEKPAVSGEAREKPAAGGEAREKPAAGGEAREKPAAGGEAREKPAEGGEAREKSVAGREAREKSVAGGEAREKSVAGGEAREKSVAGGEAREKSVAGGEARERSVAGSEAREKSVAGGEARERSVAGGEARERSVAGGEARERSAVGREAREKSAEGREAREKSAEGREAREKSGERREAREKSGERREAREKSGERREAREKSGERREAREKSGERREAREKSGERREAREKSGERREGREAREKSGERREAREKSAAGRDSREKPTADAVARERQDGAYFHSYSDVSIHEEMIADAARTGTYRRALQWGCRQGPQPGAGVGLLRGLSVLDVGAGTGILSAFCAQAGAARVYACEACGVMVERAREVVAANGLRGRVRVMQGRVEDARLPEPVDAIVSEWMGYGLMYESMLRSVLHARDRWLKPGGLMFPCRAELYLAPVTDPALQERLSFWAGVKERHGVDMSCMGVFARHCLMNDEMAVTALHGEDVLGRPSMFAAIDLYTVTEQELVKLGGDFTTTSFGITTMHAFALWFNVIFPTSAPTSKVALATSTNANGPGATGSTANGGQAASFNVQDRDIPGPRAASVDADFKTGTIANNECHASCPNLCEASANTVNANTIRHNAFTANSDNLQSFNVNGDDHRTVDVNAKELEPIVLSTSPFAEETHWKQSLLYLDEPVELFQDTVLKGKITLTPAEDNPRYLRISLTYEIGDSGKKTKIFKMGEDFPPFE
ncbi:uncharacterized protein LOC144606165 [Rhinoraja longicauda]